MIRVVALSDTHTYHRELGALPDGELLIHAGDLLQHGGLDELEDAAAWFIEQPHPHKVIIPGNHDGCFDADAAEVDARFEGSGVVILRGQAANIAGLKLWGSGTTPMPQGWAFALPRDSAEIKAHWAQLPRDLDLLITHGPPFQIGDCGTTHQHYGCKALRDEIFIKRPAAHLFGHVHQDGGLWAADGITYINVTTWECERSATVFDYEPSTRRLCPVHVPLNGRARYY